jgi:hypothetical protein
MADGCKAKCFTCKREAGVFDLVGFRDQLICEPCFETDSVIRYLLDLKVKKSNEGGVAWYIENGVIKWDSSIPNDPPIHPFFC